MCNVWVYVHVHIHIHRACQSMIYVLCTSTGMYKVALRKSQVKSGKQQTAREMQILFRRGP